MDLFQAALIFAEQLSDRTIHYPYDHAVMKETVAAVVETTNDVQEVATLISIARWESGGWRRDVVNCSARGDGGRAISAWQVHPFNDEEKRKACGTLVEQAEVALFHIRDSIAVCGKFHGWRGSAQITIFTHGHCRRSDEVARSHWGNAAALRKLLYTEDNQIMPKHPGAEVLLVCKQEEMN